MQQVQRQILQLIFSLNEEINDNQIAEELGKDLHEVKFHLDDLYKGGFIELIVSKMFGGETYLVTSVTPRGHMVLQNQISLDDRIDSKSLSQTFNVTNSSSVGLQQFGNQNTAQSAQFSSSNTTEVLQYLNDLKSLIDTLPANKQDVVTSSLSTIEEEVKNPTTSLRLKTALFSLWGVVRDVASFANAVTAVAERLGVHL